MNCCLQQVGSMFTIFFGAKKIANMDDAKKLDTEAFKMFFTYLIERGIYIPPSQHETLFISMAHTDAHLEKARDVILGYF